MTDLPRLDFDQVLKEVFLPNFLKVILPFVFLILIFGIIRIIFRLLLRDSRTAAVLVDGVICLAFLASCAFVGVPVVKYLIQDTEIDVAKDYNIAVNADGTPYQFTDPFDSENWHDAAPDVEWIDPFHAGDPNGSQESSYDSEALRESLEKSQEKRNQNAEYEDWHLFDPNDYEFAPAETDYNYDPLKGFNSSDLKIPQNFSDSSSSKDQENTES